MRGSAAAASAIRPAGLRVVSPMRNDEHMDEGEQQDLERWLLDKSAAWFVEPEVADVIMRLADSGSDLGLRYRRYHREVRTLAQAWGLTRPRPSGEPRPPGAG
jgi:hypothetical protein